MFHVKHIHKSKSNVSRETLKKEKNKSNVSRETLDEYYMSLAYKQAYKAFKNNEIPVGCIIVKNSKIISKSYNKREKNNKTIDHAEIIAITKANKKIKNWRLENCIMYVTMEPCMMCCGAIEQARIKKVIYGCKNETYGYLSKYKNINSELLYKEECKKIIQLFFQNKR